MIVTNADEVIPSVIPVEGRSSPSTTAARPEALAAAIIREVVGDPSHPYHAGSAAGPATPSIHEVLLPRLLAAQGGDPLALAPGRDVDRALGRLVELVTGDLAGAGAGPVLGGGILRDVEWEVAVTLDRVPELAARAADVRRAAGMAETALELHHARALTETTEPGGPTGSDRAEPGPDPVEAALGSFPYVANYRRLTSAELLGLGRHVRPRHVTFCGAGALPLTGVLAHRWSGAEVRLIEIDPETAELARRVVTRLERLGAVAPAALEVVTADAGAVDVGGTDAVFVASLVPRSARERLVARLAAVAPEGRPALVVRSAGGLVARFAYEPVDPATVAPGAYRHVGSVAPSGRLLAIGSAVLAMAHRSVLNTSEVFLPVGVRGLIRR